MMSGFNEGTAAAAESVGTEESCLACSAVHLPLKRSEALVFDCQNSNWLETAIQERFYYTSESNSSVTQDQIQYLILGHWPREGDGDHCPLWGQRDSS